MAEPKRVAFRAALPTVPEGEKSALAAWARRLTSTLGTLLWHLDQEDFVSLENVSDGQFLKRSGTTVVGAVPSAQVAAATLLKYATGEGETTLPAVTGAAAPTFATFMKWAGD